MNGYSVYQLDICNGKTAFIVASDEVVQARIFTFGVACGIPSITSIKRLGPVLATMLDALIVPDANFEQTIKELRGVK